MLEIKENVEELTEGTQHKVIVNDGGIYIHIDKLTKETVDMLLKLRDELKAPGPHFVDYSSSPLKNYLAHPEDVNRTLAWLHLHIDFQTEPTMKLQPLRALIVHKVFSSTVPQNVFEAEFGKVAQSVYSRCIGSGDRYDKKDLEILAESYKTFDYEKFLKHI